METASQPAVRQKVPGISLHFFVEEVASRIPFFLALLAGVAREGRSQILR